MVDAELSELYRGCWGRLHGAAELGTGGGWRIPVLATLRDGVLRQRSIVLRRVEFESVRLWFHTDVRSGKVSDIGRDSRVSLLFYDSSTETQLWVAGQAEVMTEGAGVELLWEQSAASSLRMYLAPESPGKVCSAGDCNLPAGVRGRIPDRAELDAGRVNFAAVVVRVERLEWLQLSRSGNQRAVFDGCADGAATGSWVLP